MSVPGDETPLRVLTIDQPYASLVALGAKWVETRPNRTHIRGRIAVHASAKVRGRRGDRTTVGAYMVERDASGYLLRGESLSWPYRLPTGAIVATAELYDCVPIYHIAQCWDGSDGGATWPNIQLNGSSGATFCPAGEAPFFTLDDQRPYGDFRPGRWAWLLRDVQRVNPVPFVGGQGWSRRWQPNA